VNHVIVLQAPKEQKSKEAKALAAANSSKGKKKASDLHSMRARSIVYQLRISMYPTASIAASCC
jgi:hypothetical protein